MDRDHCDIVLDVVPCSFISSNFPQGQTLAQRNDARNYLGIGTSPTGFQSTTWCIVPLFYHIYKDWIDSLSTESGPVGRYYDPNTAPIVREVQLGIPFSGVFPTTDIKYTFHFNTEVYGNSPVVTSFGDCTNQITNVELACSIKCNFFNGACNIFDQATTKTMHLVLSVNRPFFISVETAVNSLASELRDQIVYAGGGGTYLMFNQLTSEGNSFVNYNIKPDQIL